MSNRSLEEPESDSAEQHQDAIPSAAESADEQADDRPLEADEADVAEQAREFDLGDEDYR